MWAALRKAMRQYDAWVAFAEGGLHGARQLLREMVTFRLAPKAAKKKKPRTVLPVFEVLETREVPTTTVSAILRTDDPRELGLIPIGQAAVDLNLGAARVSQPLDFDLSPGTAMGGDPALVYNSSTVGVRPLSPFRKCLPF